MTLNELIESLRDYQEDLGDSEVKMIIRDDGNGYASILITADGVEIDSLEAHSEFECE